ncbi:MAG: carbohydrate binding domain-containing protein [Kiritimatiellae bacterium]|nr:carbohydrate binding domain-containing protein [Kiritimatiellia bacterium]
MTLTRMFLLIAPAAGLMLVGCHLIDAAGRKTGGENQKTDGAPPNFLRNGNFEKTDRLTGKPADWSCHEKMAGSNVIEWGVTPENGRAGRNCLRLSSEREGYHGGIFQKVALEPDMTYKFSAWIKADVATNDGKVVCLYYDGYNEEDGKKQWWGGSLKTLRQSADWQYVEKVIVATSRTPETVNFYPCLFYGATRVWLDDVRLVEEGYAGQPGRSVFQIKAPAADWEIFCDQGERYGVKTRAARVKREQVEGRDCLRLDYRFETAGHDCVMIRAAANAGEKAGLAAVTMYGDGSGHELFLILEDNGGENHYLPITPVYWKGWRTVYRAMDKLYRPPRKHEIHATCWGGDSNQVVDLPLKRITVGMNDWPDEYRGRGRVWLEKAVFLDRSF